MGSSDYTIRSSPVAVQLYGDVYSEDWWWWGDLSFSNLYTIESFTQPLSATASWIESLLEALRLGYEAEVVVSLGSCADNSSQAMSFTYGDCSQACFDSNNLYLPFNLDACLALGATAMLIQNGSMNLEATDAHTVSAIKDYSIGNLSSWDGTSIVQNIVDCALASCTENNVASCPSDMLSLDGLNVTAANLQTVYDGLNTFCDNVGTKVNADIAGPGVMFSYIVQICAAFTLWALAKVLTSWVRVLAWPFLLCSSRAPPSTDPLLSEECRPRAPGRRRSAWIRATEIQTKLGRLRLHAATSTTLVEFQEIQAFFVAAIQIATLATFKPKVTAQSDFANTSTFGEAINDSQLVQTLCINGTLPILLIQCLLQRYGMRWWYTFTLCMVTFILAIVVQARSNYLIADFATLWAIFLKTSSVDACGGMANPQVYCDVYSTVYASSSGVYGIYIAVPILIVDFMAPTILRLPSVRAILNTWWRTSRVFRYIGTKVWRPFIKTFWFLVELILVYFVVWYFIEILNLFGEMDGSLGSWSFGQLIAVTVWVPPLLKFIYYNTFGIEAGLGHRLARDYRVVHDEQPIAQSDDMALGIVDLDEFQQGHEGPTDSPYASDIGPPTPSMGLGSYDHLIQSPPEPYSADYKGSKGSWPRRWPGF